MVGVKICTPSLSSPSAAAASLHRSILALKFTPLRLNGSKENIILTVSKAPEFVIILKHSSLHTINNKSPSLMFETNGLS